MFSLEGERELPLVHREFGMTNASFTQAIMAVATGNSCSYHVGLILPTAVLLSVTAWDKRNRAKNC